MRAHRGTTTRRVLVATAFVGALMVGGTLSPAGAKPIRGCPTAAWELRDAQEGGIGDKPADANADGKSCWLEAPVGSGIFTIIDNSSNGNH